MFTTTTQYTCWYISGVAITSRATIFVCKAEIQNIMVVKNMLICFKIVSGLKVNFKKSKIGSTKV